MNQYPIVKIDKEEWNKKVSACLMYTIPSEDQALPILTTLEEILQRLHKLPLQQTLTEDLVEFFFIQVFPVVCQKIIKSRYFKNPAVLKKSNQILQKTVCLLPLYIDWLDKIPQFIQIFQSVFPQQFYFKTNNQLQYKDYVNFSLSQPYLYFAKQYNIFEHYLEKGSKVDIMKFASNSEKFYWSHGQIVQITQSHILVAYQLDYDFAVKKIQTNSYYIATYQSRCTTFQWRKSIKTGDKIDALDSFGGWYNATVIGIEEQSDGRRKVQVTLKVYDENGNKSDENGKFYGFSDYKEKYDAFGAQIAPYCSIAKQFCYESSKSQFDTVDDQNDMEFTFFENKKVYALPRKKHLSQTIFLAMNKFGQLGGFQKTLKKIQQKGDLALLALYLKGLSGVSAYLHKQIVLEQISRIKLLLQKNILSDHQSYTKQKSQMLFSGLRALLKRVYMNEVSYEYQNNLKITLVESNFDNDSLKKKLHGLNQLKEIVKTLTFGSTRNKKIIDWIKQKKIFDKVYLVNSHVQLIKKSESFFRYIINESILEVQDLQKLLKMAQKGDYQTRISLYALFQEVSHIFKKPHVNFLIDKILQTQPSLILNQDIDLLHQLSKFSNYFPTKKVMAFFEKLTLGEQIPQQINSYAIKKYSQMVAKNYEMKSYRKQVIKQLLSKLVTHDVTKVSKILKFIFEGLGFGEWGKKDLNDMLQQQKFEDVIISCISSAKEMENKKLMVEQCMSLLLCIYKLCSSFKIQIKVIQKVYEQVYRDKKLTEIYYKWCNEVFKCEQGIQVENIAQLQDLFLKLFQNRKMTSKQDKHITQKVQNSLLLQELQLLKSIFIEINKRKMFISVSNTMRDKEIEKQYRRKVSMKQLTFYHSLLQFIYDSQNISVASKSIDFFRILYCSGQNTSEEIQTFLKQNIEILKLNATPSQLTEENKWKVLQTLRIIEFLIDDSQKDSSAKIQSLISKGIAEILKLNFINAISSIGDTIKKMEVTIPDNFTLYSLRQHLAKQLDIPYKTVKIEFKREIPFLSNCRTIKELGLTGFQMLTVSRRFAGSEPEGQIIIDGELNPKAERVFKKIFDKYSTDGQMNRIQCHQFTVKCLGSSSSPKFYEQKINNLFKQYDQDQDNLLVLKDFLRFYKNAASSRGSTVWSNLRSFGVLGNFKFSDEPNEQIPLEKLPRSIISNMPQIYDLLFQLLIEKEVAPLAFQLLQRLPVSRQVEDSIISVSADELKFEYIFDSKELYIFFYKLKVVEYLSFSTELKTEAESQWVYRFISNKGIEKIIQILFRFIQIYEETDNKKNRVLLEIIITLIQISRNFLVKCYATKQISTCQAFFNTDFDISQKIEYLVTGRFSKNDHIFKQSEIDLQQTASLEKYSKLQILQNLVNLLETLWRAKQIDQNDSNLGSNEVNENTQFLQVLLISRIMNVIPLLQLNQNFSGLVSRMDLFINYAKNQKFLKKFYELILCVAFYTEEGKGQKTIINEMFKHLTMKNIISEHFSILAALVSKYGVQTTNEKFIVEALMNNIFSSENELTIEGCSRLILNFNIQNLNQAQFDVLWENCLFGEQKRAKKNTTREALYELILKATDNKPKMTNYIIAQVKKQIAECIEHMRITSCTEDNQRSPTGYAGLKNLGNICYINSMMQQLYMNKKFRYLILRIKDNEPQSLALYKQKMYDDNILHQFQRLFAYLELTSRADYVLSGFCLAYKPFGQSVNVMIQQDVQEFVSMFFDQLQNKIKQTPFKRVLDIFYGGKSTNLFTCHDCNQTKKVEENFYSITLQVKNSKTLNDSFNRYASGELISDFRCDFCNKKVDVSKKTRISKPPKILIIHLQRIFFNLDTFINEKITTKHVFPMNLDLYPYSLSQFQKAKETTPEEEKKLRDLMQYNLIGIICHIGNAQSGHYLSYIKIEENKWVQFNDSLVSSFNPNNIQPECFGGVINSYMDEFQWDRTSQTSKSAYILLYQRQGQTKIEAIVKSLQQKQAFLKQYTLSQVLDRIKGQQNDKQQKNSENQSSSDSQSDPKDKLEEQILKLQVQEQFRKKSRDLSMDIDKQLLEKEVVEAKQLTVQIEQNISAFIPQNLKRQIDHDNEIHFFQKNLASPAFVKFFAFLLRHQHQSHDSIIKVLKNLTFGFWTKSSHFKDLLKTCTHFIECDSKYSEELIFTNPQIVTYLIQNPDSEVRTGVAEFLANTFSSLIQKHHLTLQPDSKVQMDKQILLLLDQLFSLLPTQVSKSWTKFGQYFQFWYEFSKKGSVQLAYMIRKQILKHFLDYYLDKKSPLKIYYNKPQIGSKYANPNFSILLKTVTFLIHAILGSDKIKLSNDDYSILTHFDCMEKLISQNYEKLAINLVKQICHNNIHSSQRVAIVLLKGLQKSTFNNVQPYLDVLHAFVLIQDTFQELRMNWVLGKPVLHLSAQGKIHAMNSYSFEERLYTYHSSISLEQAASLLDPIFELHKRAENFAMMSLKEALKLCIESDRMFCYIWSLPPPTLCYGHLYEFYNHFIEKYLEDAKRSSYNYSQTGFNKEELVNEVKKMYNQLDLLWKSKLENSFKESLELSKQTESNPLKQQLNIQQQSSTLTSNQINNTQKDTLNLKNKQKIKQKIYFPIKFNFIEKQKTVKEGLQITRHQSELTLAPLEPNLKSNQSFLTGGMQRNIDRLKQNVLQQAKNQIATGYFIQNKSKNLLRIKTEDGSLLIKSGDSGWVWGKQIQKVWQCERTEDWPKWSLFNTN